LLGKRAKVIARRITPIGLICLTDIVNDKCMHQNFGKKLEKDIFH
jgi:hypothetical protein